MNIFEKLMIIQQELKAPKSQYNSYGKYNYRNNEDILEAVKPLLKKTKTALILSDRIYQMGERTYVEATAKLIDVETDPAVIVENTASAREDDDKKGFDAMQLTGATSSYARKYALNGLFAIDDNKDSDTINCGDDRKGSAQKMQEKKLEKKEMTYEEACAFVTPKGAKFGSLTDDQLVQISKSVKREEWKEAANLILSARKQRDLESMAEELADSEEYPWDD